VKYLTVEDLPHYTTISVNEAAHVCGIGRSTAYNAVSDGQFFETVRIKNRLRVLAQPLYKKLMGSAHPGFKGAEVEESEGGDNP
jgi:predicted DNA-binding transcriptional regulator AlpA